MGQGGKAVIFDFEGTLVDFQWRPAEAEAELRNALGPVYDRWDADALGRWAPRPEGIRRVLAELKVAPEEALFVGDSRADVLAARASGIRVAIVRGGECDEADFAALPPDDFVSRLDEI
ncbi:MAG: HAD hydrolase-like protein [Burkholderiales bacterium]|jgi:phosphoglycolate phosphatase-like HAD superfamily hydrolase|nr:Phosphoglycolate phosphatase [Rhodocyclaceae bacterium]MBW7950844.1 HAD hydrolase-like protein [Pseudorhodoplanes sp.]MCZ2174905.1 HAD hydrolase-like protein [Burkholderiales bacterium]MCZ2421415.1 HAD hydrolase-like protein [Burkholderiales bacterium]OQY72001.1 MAG: hypothetical protein B6D47_05870 [Rhodocyclaceae bacterium UTPRO2]